VDCHYTLRHRIGGVGINLAIQDAVAAANILAERLARQTVSVADLQRVQLRREFPTRMTQEMQIIVQNRLVDRILGSDEQIPLPWPVKLIQRWPLLRRIPESPPLGTIIEQAVDPLREGDVVAWRHEHRLPAVFEHGGDAADATGDDRLAGGHPLEQSEGHALETGGADDNVHRGEQVGHLGVRSLADKRRRRSQLACEAL